MRLLAWHPFKKPKITFLLRANQGGDKRVAFKAFKGRTIRKCFFYRKHSLCAWGYLAFFHSFKRTCDAQSKWVFRKCGHSPVHGRHRDRLLNEMISRSPMGHYKAKQMTRWLPYLRVYRSEHPNAGLKNMCDREKIRREHILII